MAYVQRDGFDFRAILEESRRHWQRGAVLVTVTVVVALIITLLIPSWYRSGANFAVETTSLGNVSGVLGLASQLGLSNIPGSGLSVTYYQQVLTSDRVLDRVALGAIPMDSMGPKSRMFTDDQAIASPRQREKARQRLQDHFGTSTNGRANTVSFWIEGRTPYGARAAAETVLVALNEMISEIRRHRDSAERAFLESRLDSATIRETALEDSLRTFYVTNRIINTPNLQFIEARLKRKVDFALELVSQLRAQVEQAKLQEVHDTPVLSVISEPDIPGKRSYPNRRLVLIVALFGGIAVYFTWVALSLSNQRSGPRTHAQTKTVRAAVPYQEVQQ